MEIIVKIVDDEHRFEPSILIKMERSETILDLKRKIESVDCRLPMSRQRLVYRGKVLNNSEQSLNELQIAGNDSIYLILAEQLEIILKDLIKFSEVCFPVISSWKLSQLKEIIYQREKIPPNEQVLVFNGNTLEDTHLSLEELRITHLSTIYLIPSGCTKIYLRSKDRIIPLPISLSDTISSVKQKYQRIEGVHSALQNMYFKTRLLQDKESLSWYGIESETIVDIHLSASMKIVIRTLFAKLLFFDVKPSETIGEIKRRIYSQEEIPISDQILVLHNGTVLQEDSTLDEYGIAYNYSTLQLLQNSKRRSVIISNSQFKPE